MIVCVNGEMLLLASRPTISCVRSVQSPRPLLSAWFWVNQTTNDVRATWLGWFKAGTDSLYSKSTRSVRLSACLSVSLCRSVCLSLLVCLLVCLCLCGSIRAWIDLSYSTSTRSVCLSVCLSVCVPVCLRLFICVSVSLSVRLFEVDVLHKSHNVTCRFTLLNMPYSNPGRQAGQYAICLPRRDKRLSWPGWLVTYWDGLTVYRQSPVRVLTGSGIEQQRWSRPTC